MKKKIKKGIVAGLAASVVGVICTTAVLTSDKETKKVSRQKQEQEHIYVEREKDSQVQETVSEENKNENILNQNSIEKEKIVKEEEEKLEKDMVVVDVHGWLNTAYGDQKVGKYFANQYGFSTQALNRSNGGYYVAYAESLGADVSLVELPKPSSPSSIESMNYSGKMINAVNNLIDNYKF